MEGNGMITRENTKTIYDLVENAGKEYGSHIFLRYEENDVIYEVSFRRFAAECKAIGAWLKEQDEIVGHKVRVGLFGTSSHQYMVTMAGAMAAGNVVVPLDISLDVEKLADCLNRADVDILFYDWEHNPRVQGVIEKCPGVIRYISLQHRKKPICTDSILEEYDGKSVPTTAVPQECAMVLFTSGTTGRGKGVMLSQANLIDNVFCTTDPGHPENEVYLGILPIHHVFCINGDVLIMLRYGSTLCLNGELKNLAAHLQLFEPSVFRCVPMIAKTLYNKVAILTKQNPDRDIEEIKHEVFGRRLYKIVCGGGYLTPELAENYRKIGISIAQGYGMSECSPKISAPDWSRPDMVASVGKIVDGCQVRIVEGEIQVKSPSVMMGYYKEPELTAEAMTEDGWLRTGDLGYVDEENFLYLTGRKKNLIILSNGENVAPEQIENLFTDDTIVEEILVFGEDDIVTAEIYPNFKYAEAAGIQDIEGTVGEIIKNHNAELPTFKQIMRWRLRDIPFEKTSSKKIIRSQYFNKKQDEKKKREAVRGPENDLQKQICSLIAQILGDSPFGIDSNLFECGMDSMGSVMLLTEMYEKLGLSMTMGELMDHSTVLKLEEFYQERKGAAQVSYEKREVYPLTNLQLYFAYVMRGNTTANLPFFFKLDNGVDLERLQASIQQLFEVHPELKAVIQMGEKGYVILRDDDKQIEIPIIDADETQWQQIKEGLLYPYLYQQGEPLYHISIYRTKEANYLFFDIAHIMGDGLSMNILFEDLNRLYAGEKLPQETYTFYEYILDEKARDERGVRAENVKYYEKLMEGMKVRRSILTRSVSYALDKGEDAVLKSRMDSLNRKEVQSFAKSLSVSENAMFLTAYNYCISIFSDLKDTISSSIHGGRTDSRWNRLTGPLFLTYFFRYTNVPHETVPQLLKKSGHQIMETMRCYISNLHADEMFFQYQGDILNIDTIGGLPAERQKIQLDALPFHLQVFTDDKGYYYELRYWKNRFDESQLKVFMTCMEAVIQAMLVEPSVRRLKKHLPESVFPKHFYIKAGKVNAAAGYELIPDVSPEKPIKVYVLDEHYLKKPFGGWGSLYVMDYPTKDYVDTIHNPYGTGTLYETGLTARILPNGTVDLLQTGGRMVLQESLVGRNFLDLHRLETTLMSYDGILGAEAYLRYGEGNKIVLAADIWTDGVQVDLEALKQYVEEKCGKEYKPEIMNVM